MDMLGARLEWSTCEYCGHLANRECNGKVMRLHQWGTLMPSPSPFFLEKHEVM